MRPHPSRLLSKRTRTTGPLRLEGLEERLPPGDLLSLSGHIAAETRPNPLAEPAELLRLVNEVRADDALSLPGLLPRQNAGQEASGEPHDPTPDAGSPAECPAFPLASLSVLHIAAPTGFASQVNTGGVSTGAAISDLFAVARTLNQSAALPKAADLPSLTTSAVTPEQAASDDTDVSLAESTPQAEAADTTTLLVQLRDGVAGADLAEYVSTAGAAVSATDIRGLYRVETPASIADALMTAIVAQPAVEYAEPLSYVELASTSPRDPEYARGTQWGLNSGNGINAAQAWDVTRGSTRVVTALIDTGADYNHPDLYENIWLNQGEIPASRRTNLLDVDGDARITFRDLKNAVNQGVGKITDINGDGRISGADVLAPMNKNGLGQDLGTGGWADGVSNDGGIYIDDLVGWDFYDNDNNPFDARDHGTHLAGIVAATGDNNAGLAGINWSAQLMPVKIFGSASGASSLQVASAIRYSFEHGARVANASWNGVGNSTTIHSAIQDAATHVYGGGQGTGMVFVTSAGNSARNLDVTPDYPAAWNDANLLAVAATDVNGKLATFSNYGATTIDVGAPGVNVLSTVPVTPTRTYALNTGTSMAAPHASGVAALLLAQHPTWSASQVVQRITTTATPAAALAGKSVSGGIVNAAAALGASPAPVVEVNLASAYNRLGISTDGQPFAGTGLDGGGRALSANLLGGTRLWSGLPFTFGPAGANDVVAATGQTINLPAGTYASLTLLGTGVNAAQLNQTFTVTYADLSTQTFTQTFSSWLTQLNNTNESVALTMPRRNLSSGAADSTPVNVYGYRLALNSAKAVKSITLPNNGNVVVLAMTLTPASAAPQVVALTGIYNRVGIATANPVSGGLDGHGNAYDYQQFLAKDYKAGFIPFNGMSYPFAYPEPNNTTPDVVGATGQTITLPAGTYASLTFLGTAVNAAQLNQTFTITYADLTTQSFTQSFSTWLAPQNLANEAHTGLMYRHITASGTRVNVNNYLYGYRIGLDASKVIQSITLPNNGNLVVVAMNLVPADVDSTHVVAPRPVDLIAAFNRLGMTTNGQTFPATAGIDTVGHALSATLLGSSLTWSGVPFALGAANVSNVVYATGQTLPLPPGNYTQLHFLASTAWNNYPNETFTLHYATGPSQTVSLSFTVWTSAGNYAGESIVQTLPVRNNADGTQSPVMTRVRGYTIAIDPVRTLTGITLPRQGKINILAVTLV